MNYTNQVLQMSKCNAVGQLHNELVALVTNSDSPSKNVYSTHQSSRNVWCGTEQTWCYISRFVPLGEESKYLDQAVDAYDLMCSYERAGEILATL